MIATHPELEARGSFAHLRLGKQPRKNDPRTLRLAKYLVPETLPAIPEAVDWATPVSSWPMYGNDRLGDCTCAAAGHMIEAWTAGAGAARVPIDSDVEALYWSTGSADTGRYELDVLNAWRVGGLGGDKITAYVAIDPSTDLDVRAGAFLFGGLYIGVALPLTAQSQQIWDVVGDGKTGSSAPGSWGGHAVDVVGYDADGLTVVTWGATMKMTWAFWAAYVDEAYAIVTPDWIDANGHAPSGFALDELLADLKQVEAQATPEGITIGDEPDVGVGPQTIPVLPWEIALRNAVFWMEKLSDGSVVLKFAPASTHTIPGHGPVTMPMPPGVEIVFGPDGWASFKEQVAADGEKKPEVVVPRTSLIVPGR